MDDGLLRHRGTVAASEGIDDAAAQYFQIGLGEFRCGQLCGA